MTSTPINKKKSNKNAKEVIERFPPPEIEGLTLEENLILKSALNNNYQSICGAYDAKEHPLSTYITENKIFDKRDEYGKSAFDLAAYIGNKDFIKAILLRTDEKIDENVFNLRNLLKSSNSYNFMHYACIWGRVDLVKLLVDQQKLIVDPDLNEFASNSNGAMQSKNSNVNTKTLGCILLRAKTKTGETPRDLAKRYNHQEIFEFLTYAEKRQTFVDTVQDIKQLSTDPEKNQNKISKDDKKKLDKLFADSMDWIDKNKESTDMELLEAQMRFIESEVKPIIEKINQDPNASQSNITAGSVSQRSKA